MPETRTAAEDRAGLRVMVVDDHPMWREGVERDLAEAGFSVVASAGTGESAINRFGATQPDVVVLDLQIPDPNGVEVTKEMIRRNAAVKVLILSASGEQEDVLEAVKAGAIGYLVKSASRSELIAAVDKVAAGETVFTPGLAGLVLGFVTTWGEPAVRILADQVDNASNGSIRRSLVLYAICFGVCVSGGLGLLRIGFETPLLYFLVPGYLLVLVIMWLSNREWLQNLGLCKN